jgi:probable rRNA maturation factor
MRRLNREWRRKDRPTDVLSFPLMEGARFPSAPGEPRRLGDLVVCPAVARRQARERGVPAAAEIELLLVHGVLHLLGHDHDRASRAQRMFRLQASILGRARSGKGR